MEIHHHHSRPPAFQPKMNYSPRHGTSTRASHTDVPPFILTYPKHQTPCSLDTVHGFLITPRPVAHTIKPHKDAFPHSHDTDSSMASVPHKKLHVQCSVLSFFLFCSVLYLLFSLSLPTLFQMPAIATKYE
ncbi:hypothetical protein KC19_5G137600 [Ceratodon purpureus]|uniref:Uncharacterized protein n=1 Tax=Ceratodon purpureus TaxID=3225 RepID=A0A8T0I174_CERPU|nr:hypothetical protein KC19_5G137600 [Ceratodon purpureus]